MSFLAASGKPDRWTAHRTGTRRVTVTSNDLIQKILVHIRDLTTSPLLAGNWEVGRNRRRNGRVGRKRWRDGWKENIT